MSGLRVFPIVSIRGEAGIEDAVVSREGWGLSRRRVAQGVLGRLGRVGRARHLAEKV